MSADCCMGMMNKTWQWSLRFQIVRSEIRDLKPDVACLKSLRFEI